MLKIFKETSLPPEKILERAATFFGRNGEGMDEKERNVCCVAFEGYGGFVRVSVGEESGKRTVEVETREYEYQAKRFLAEL